MKSTLYRSTTLALVATAALAFVPVSASAQSEEQKLVNKAETTLSNMLRDPEMTWLQQNIGRARAVLIAPEIVKAGFIFGGSGGRAVLLAKEGGKWHGPSFYTMATASVGFQAGVQVSENVTLVMTEKGMNSMLAANFKIGGDASVAAGPVGAGAKSDVTADLIAFSRAKGVYGAHDLTQSFEIGNSLIVVASTRSHYMNVYYKRHFWHRWPISTGRPGDDTPNGTYVTIDGGFWVVKYTP